MALSSHDIERIVTEVLRRLQASGVRVQLDPGSLPGIASDSAKTATYTVTEHVVSLAVLEGHLENLQRLVVGARAVVTPAVRDALREHDIALERAGA
ncbi:MAG: hypothetical protein OSB47_09490 [Pirellulaceae bacterium]|nr:hypothetical protein [Pirellulaceae bacterium]